jgi:hypothetical protein
MVDGPLLETCPGRHHEARIVAPDSCGPRRRRGTNVMPSRVSRRAAPADPAP